MAHYRVGGGALPAQFGPVSPGLPRQRHVERGWDPPLPVAGQCCWDSSVGGWRSSKFLYTDYVHRYVSLVWNQDCWIKVFIFFALRSDLTNKFSTARKIM